MASWRVANMFKFTFVPQIFLENIINVEICLQGFVSFNFVLKFFSILVIFLHHGKNDRFSAAIISKLELSSLPEIKKTQNRHETNTSFYRHKIISTINFSFSLAIVAFGSALATVFR